MQNLNQKENKPLKFSGKYTLETERVMAELIIEDPNISSFFKPVFFQKLESLNDKR